MLPLRSDKGNRATFCSLRPGAEVATSLLTFGLLLVALSVVGMHQLSVGHSMVTFLTTDAAPKSAANDRGSKHTGNSHQVSPATAAVNAGGTDTSIPAPGDQAAGPSTAAVTATTSVMGSDATDCAGCGQHTMAVMTCLLVLTVLIPPWLHRLPTSTRIPLFLTKPRLTSTPFLSRLLPALSLVELSLRRI